MHRIRSRFDQLSIDRMQKNLLRITVNGIAGSVAVEVDPHQVELLQKDPVYRVVTSH